MGIEEIFYIEAADLSGFFNENEVMDIRVDNVIHKAFISVNEGGTEAAAATGNIFHYYARLFFHFPRYCSC